jgi:hypothetical protein
VSYPTIWTVGFDGVLSLGAICLVDLAMHKNRDVLKHIAMALTKEAERLDMPF